MFICADCKNRQFMHPIELARKCKPRCVGCGGTFFEPDSDGAHDMDSIRRNRMTGPMGGVL